MPAAAPGFDDDDSDLDDVAEDDRHNDGSLTLDGDQESCHLALECSLGARTRR